jgi:hypothetical protein
VQRICEVLPGRPIGLAWWNYILNVRPVYCFLLVAHVGYLPTVSQPARIVSLFRASLHALGSEPGRYRWVLNHVGPFVCQPQTAPDCSGL